MTRLGILGGSFDPVHLGHLWIGAFAREQLGLNRVLFVPASSPPHKGTGTVAPYTFRIEMLKLAIAPYEGFEVSEMESDSGHPSYTVETLRRIRREIQPGDDLWLLLGSDSLRDLSGWREPEEIVRLAALGIYGRPGPRADVPSGSRVRWIEGPACGLSSTMIRERLRAGRAVTGLVPAEIETALTSSDFYRGEQRGNRDG